MLIPQGMNTAVTTIFVITNTAVTMTFILQRERRTYANMFIAEYANKGYTSHAEKRERKLLLKKKEIIDIINALSRKGATLVAIRLFFDNNGRAKLEVGLGRGKKVYDKRETIKNRELDRKMRIMGY